MGISPGATHNLKVVGSNPTPAPNQPPYRKVRGFFVFGFGRISHRIVV